MLGWFYGSAKANTADSVDFYNGFDPRNGDHRDGIKEKITSLNEARWQRDKASYWWLGGSGLNLLLRLGGVYGWLVAGGVEAFVWAGWSYSQSAEFTKADKLFHSRIDELLKIYTGYLAKVGLKTASSDTTMLSLLEAISPYVDAKDLLPANCTYPADFSDQFVALLAAAPHNMEPSVLKANYSAPNLKPNSVTDVFLNNASRFFGQNRYVECAKRIQGEVNRAFYNHKSPI